MRSIGGKKAGAKINTKKKTPKTEKNGVTEVQEQWSYGIVKI